MNTELQHEDREAMLDAKWRKYWEDMDARDEAENTAIETHYDAKDEFGAY